MFSKTGKQISNKLFKLTKGSSYSKIPKVKSEVVVQLKKTKGKPKKIPFNSKEERSSLVIRKQP